MDTYAFFSDPRALPLAERRAARDRFEPQQRAWRARLRQLVEGEPPADDFPAFLLATPPFADLAHRLVGATRRSDLPAAAADELDWFLRAFADYLRTDADEDVFREPHRLTG